MPIDDETLKALGELALKVANNQKTRRQFFQAVKEVAPERYERQADQVMQDKLDELRSELATEKEEREREKVQIRLEAARDALKSRYADDDIKKIETLMQDLGIADYEKGARVYAAEAPAKPRNEPPRPSATWELPKFDGLLKDPIGASRDMAFAVIDELNRGKR